MPKRYLHGPMTWKVMQRNVWKISANWRIKRHNNFSKSRHHARMTINLEKNKLDQFENSPQFAHKIVPKCVYLARVGRPDFFGLWINLLRALTIWTKACDQTFGALDLLHSSHSVNTSNIVMWETQHDNAVQDCFKILTLQETSKTRSQHQEGSCVFSEAEH